MNIFERTWAEVRLELETVSVILARWFAEMTAAEKLLGVCMLIMLFFLLVLRRSAENKSDRSELFQFIFAMSLVIMAGFGVGWFFDPSFAR